MSLSSLQRKEGTKLLNLIKNEYCKIFKKWSTYVLLGGILLITIFFTYMIHTTIHFYEGNEWSDDYYMSEQETKERIADIKNNTYNFYGPFANEEEKNNELAFLNKVQELGLYSKEDWVYQGVRCYVTKQMLDPIHKLKQNLSQDTYEKLLEAIKKSDHKSFLEVSASMVEPLQYDFEGSEHAIVNVYQFCLDHDISLNGHYSHIQTIFYETLDLQDSLQGYKDNLQTNQATIDQDKETYAINMYQLEHGLDYVLKDTLEMTSDKPNFWMNFMNSGSLATLISLFIIVIAGGCIASEFSNGTIKFLVINPVKRGKILWSKYFTVISLALITIVAYFILNLLLSILFYGTADLSIPYLQAPKGVLVVKSGFIMVAKVYLSGLIEIICYGTMAFMISSLLRSASIAIGVGVGSLIAGNIITLMIAQFNLDWGRYLIFANTNLFSIKDGMSVFPNQSMTMAVIVMIAHLFVFILTAYDGFVRREI